MLILTGTGHCGTKYAAHVLRAGGLRCGHECWYGHGGVVAEDRGDWEADCSYSAAAHLPIEGATVVHIVRHPLPTIWSWLTVSGRASREMFARVLDLPVPQDERDLAFWTAVWVGWNRHIEPHADWRWRLEDGGEALLEVLRLRVVNPRFDFGARLNPHATEPSKLTWDDIPEREECRELAAEYGYE